MRVGKTWSIWLLLVHLCAFLQFLPLQWCFKVEQSFQKLWASLCIFMALKEDVMYVNWDGRTFLSCQNDGVYILFSTLGARQNTLFLTPPAAALEEYYSSSSELRVHFNFSSLSNWARLLTQLQLLLLIFLTKDSERANVVVTILGILYIINHR